MTSQLVEIIHSSSVITVYIAGGIILLITAISLVTSGKTEKFKRALFSMLVVSAALPTLYFVGSTLYVNAISETKGPVHWHLDFRIFACGEEIGLAPPDGFLSNKVGTPTFHHHNDKRIHVEGVVVDKEDFELEDFFRTIGGELTKSSFTIPATKGDISFQNGEACPDGSLGEWQAFIYKTEDRDQGRVSLSKLENFTNYLMSSEQTIPPGDCVIFEFEQTKPTTEHTCNFYQVGFDKGELRLVD